MFQLLLDLRAPEPLVVVIDEFPYLADDELGLATVANPCPGGESTATTSPWFVTWIVPPACTRRSTSLLSFLNSRRGMVSATAPP